MKKFVMIVIMALACAISGSAASSVTNYPIPVRPDTLRILGVGNSFTDDGMMYLPQLLAAAGVKNVVLGRLYIGSCSLERHVKEYRTSGHNYIYYKSTENSWVTMNKKASLLDGLLDENWDVIVVQQVSGLSGIYSSYHPWLDELMKILRFNCRNAGACIAWQQTWAYASTSTHADFVKYNKNQMEMYLEICGSTQMMVDKGAIDIVIPTGTAIQNLRDTTPDAREMTRDGHHLNYKMGRYTAACTWFQAIVAPAFGITVEDNSCRLAGSRWRMSDAEAKACQLAARHACACHYSVWTE